VARAWWAFGWRLTDAVLGTRLFAHAGVKRGFRRRAEPDWVSPLRTKACVNLMVLWKSIARLNPAGYGTAVSLRSVSGVERRCRDMRQDIRPRQGICRFTPARKS